MNGLELSEAYFRTYGMPMLQDRFPDLLPHLAAGLTGSGSECFGYDDDISRDHDFEPGFCLFLPNEETVSRQDAFRLERAYAALPKVFMGFERALVQPVGGARHGVIRIADFLMDKTGTADGNLTVNQWMTVPEYALAEVVNGRIFYDGSGHLSDIRERLSHYPEDILRKKLAARLLLMGQSGQYNYMRCIRHGETGAAQLAVSEFVRHSMQVVFLLNKTYMPYYKWSFRAMRSLPRLSLLAELLEYLLTTDNDGTLPGDKLDVIEGISGDVIEELTRQHLTQAICGDLEKHAYSVNDGIHDTGLRNLHILAGE